MSTLREVIEHSSKTKKFMMILVAILAVSAVLSFIAREILDAQKKPVYKVVAVVSSDKQRATSMVDGIQSYLNKINNNKTSMYHYEMELLNDNDPELNSKLQGLSGKQNYVGIIGFYEAKDKIVNLNNIDIPIYSMSSFSNDDSNQSKDFYQIINNKTSKAAFIANYMRNVKKEHFAYFAHDGSSQCLEELNVFDALYKKFEIPLQGTVSTSENIKNYFEKVNLGAVYICGNEKTSLNILSQIKASKTELNTYGSDIFALNSFKKQTNSSSDTLNGIFTISHLMFDTSNEEAQSFLNSFRTKYSYDPDWLSAIFYDMTKIAFENKLSGNKQINGTIQKYDLTQNSFELPIKMGQFNGEQLISTPIQLQNIKNKHSISNYIQALRDSRVLFVNDKFMYKTNVVYTGVKINSISQIKQDEENANVDFSIWFRYQGDFDPSQIEFLNGGIKLEKPEEKIDMENDHYVRFRLKGIFKMNFEKDKRSYGANTINIVYRHKQFNQNNLLFVTDLLGMPSNQEMVRQMQERAVIDTTLRWNITDFIASQFLIKDLSEGKPQYIGYQGEDTLFSTMNIELKIESSMIKAKDFIDKKYFVYLLILALVGLVVANLMDSKRLGKYWYVQVFILRSIFLPTFIVSLGNIVLDWAYVNADHVITSYLVLFYESLWWLIPAYLIDSAIRRFVWIPIHEKTAKKVPQIIVFLVSFLIYILASSGIIAFVFQREITNILAASGMLVMIIGLAIKANIANVFSGLILNMDRPFKVGESIEVDKLSGIVVDIGWRATKLKTSDGVFMLIPNEKISNAKTILNFSRGADFEQSMNIYLKPELNPEKIIPLMKEAVEEANFIIKKHDEQFGYSVVYCGITEKANSWVSNYKISFTVESMKHSKKATNSIWGNLYKIFDREQIELWR